MGGVLDRHLPLDHKELVWENKEALLGGLWESFIASPALYSHCFSFLSNIFLSSYLKLYQHMHY